MKTSGITAVLPAQDLDRAQAFYTDKVGLEVTVGVVGLTVGDGTNELFVYPARGKSSGDYTQAVIQVTDVGAIVGEMQARGVVFEEYDTPEMRTENAIAKTPDGGEAAWFKDSEGNLVGIAKALDS